MKKVISFSIYGNLPKYTRGLIRNIELRDSIYPDWTIYIYYNETVPKEIIDEYKKYSNVVLFDMTYFSSPGMIWRFFPMNDVERFISRDADSRLSMREKHAVDEWIRSGKKLHIMRDHPHHKTEMYGGMFGLMPQGVDLKNDYVNWRVKESNVFKRDTDVHFLKEFVYKRLLNDQICHDSVFTIYPNSKPFPTKLDDYKFIGEIYDIDENGNDVRFWQYKEWIGKTEL